MASVYDEAGQGLRSDRLYVHPDASTELSDGGMTFDEQDRADVQDRLANAAVPYFIAVLPSSADLDARRLYQANGERAGVYLLITPDGYDAGSTDPDTVPGSQADEAARQALDEASGDLGAAIPAFVDEVDGIASGGTNGGANGDSPNQGGSGWLPLGLLLAAGGGGLLLYRRNKRARERVELEQVRTVLDEDITEYGEELTGFDLDVQSPAVSAEARDEYGQALDLYDRAKTGADDAERPDDLRPVTAALEQGRWLLACVRARLAGETPPPRRLPCFFDPRHGPSVADITWTPPGGVEREVPACAVDVERIEGGDYPESRMVSVNGERRPYWDAGPAYAGWAGGYYAGFLPALMWGTMLGSSFAHAPMYADGGGGFGGGGFDGGFGGGGFDGGFGGGGFDGGF